jgi:ATP-dependent DNA helicase RecG
MSEEYLKRLLTNNEDYGLEFKKAADSFSRNKLRDYSAAIANEDGGYLILGVNNDRKIVGTKAFIGNCNKLAHQLTQDLKIRIKVYEITADGHRVLVFQIPRHITGTPVQVKGGTGKYRYPIRDGESLVEMEQSALESIFAEKEDDWSANYTEDINIDDLDINTLNSYRISWSKKTGKPEYLNTDYKSMLNDLCLMSENKVTNAAVLLFGTEQTIYKVAPDAEIIFEWRNNSKDIAYGERKNWRKGFINIKDDIWNVINARNTVFRYQEGFVQSDIESFDEESIREAIVNAFAHRDYTITGRSIIIKASPEQFYIENPGRLMPGVTVENILDKTAWRNRLLAESLEKVNIMERSSQGMDKIFRNTIEAGKGSPVLRISSDPSVELTIPTSLVDQNFISFLGHVANKHQTNLSLKEIIELERIRKGSKITNLEFKDKFLSLGIIEKIGQGRGSKYILSHQYYTYANDAGSHTRLAGLSRTVKRSIIIEHLKTHGKVTNSELQKAMPDMDMQEISNLLKGMRKDGLITYTGKSPRWGHWHIDPKNPNIES